MPESFEILGYFEHLRRRWPVMAVACGVALALALAVALLTPARYTATARIVIEPPAGTDSRITVAMSPMYMESLKSYELVASGDRLFRDAVAHFRLQYPKSVNELGRSVLKVSIPRNTKILEISVTLHDPVQAQALALCVAQQTVKVTHDLSHDIESQAVAGAQKQMDEARARMEQAELAWARVSEQNVKGNADRAAQAGVAKAERDAARESFDAAGRQLDETRSGSGEHGERLRVVDPGVVPERASWPNIPLMLFAAFLVALVASLLYVTLEWNYGPERAASPRSLAPLARVKTGND
jgi:uncharacterized protein involved in exopolysaccharide biosynthesis